MLALGVLILAVTAGGPIHAGGFLIDYHWMILGSLLAGLGVDVLHIGFFARVFALTGGVERGDPPAWRLLRWVRLGRGLLAGAALTSIGLGIDLKILYDWIRMGYSFGGAVRIRPALIALTLMVIGVQLVFSSFFYSILGTSRRPPE